MSRTPPPLSRLSDEAILARPSVSLWTDAWYRLIRNKAAVLGMIIVVLFILVAVLAPWIAPHDPLKINDGKGYLPPPWMPKELSATGKAGDPEFFLGTDNIGRDVLSRVLYGARVSIVVAFVPTAIIVFVGVIIGLAAGYAGGRWDNLLMRITDVVWGFPDLLFFVVVMIALRDTPIGDFANGLLLLFGALAVVNWVGIARVVRGQTLSLKEKEFVEAARSIGTSDLRIMARHILPNALSPIIVMTAFRIPGMIITEAILGYLGLGLRPGTDPKEFFVTSWGSLLLQGQSALNAQPWLLLSPAICVALVVMGFTFLGDGLRDALDPRMRGTS
jgi:ABC-type dipeptide/oligopeptide/nickel transport system permease subunit